MTCRRQLFLQITFILTISCCCASDRFNSKRLRWDQETDKQQDSTKPPLSRTYHDSSQENREKMFINNMAYDLSKKEQALMWDLYLRKGYGPSAASFEDDLTSPSFNSIDGTDNQVDIKHHASKRISAHSLAKDSKLKTYPDVIASRILDQYELSKASRIVTEYENDITNEIDNESNGQSTQAPTTTGQPSVEDKLVLESNTSGTSLFSYLWEMLKDNIDELLGREMRDTIVNTLWSWWMAIVEFAKARGKRAIQGSMRVNQ